tara:strand:- start:1955 stop:2593 length:639 start_codon:yes stop_codon:yes gene_type:complete
MSNIDNYKGIFGFGLFENKYMDLLNLYFLGIAGIIIKIFFSYPGDEIGSTGPAITTLWGYGLTVSSLFILFFLVYSYNLKLYNIKYKEQEPDSDKYLSGNIIKKIFKILFDSIPIILTIFLIIYIMYLNFSNMKQINKSNGVAQDYYIYNNISSFLIIVQILLIYKYVWDKIVKNDFKKDKIYVGLTYLISTINLILIIIMHIILYFYTVGR